MPRRCTICGHKSRAKIDQALVERQAFRNIAAQFQVSTSALVRHSDDHLPSALVKAQEAKEAEDLHTVLNAIRVTQGTVELLGKLAGQLRDAPTINLVFSAEWQAVQANILTALDPYPDARLAVAHALGETGIVGHA